MNRVLKLSESGLGTLKREQELSMRHLFNCIDVMAKIFQMFVMMCGVRNKRKRRGFWSIIMISPFQSIMRSQVSGRGKFYGNDSL